MHWVKGIVGFFLLGLAVASLIWTFENYCVTEQAAKAYNLGFQFFTSTWPSEWPSSISRTSPVFALGVVMRLALVLVPLWAVFRALSGIFAIERREAMNQIKLLDALRTLEAAIELQVRRDFKLDEHKAELHASFKKGEEEWMKRIPVLIPGITREQLEKHLSERSIP
jgi:hypothetical protein